MMMNFTQYHNKHKQELHQEYLSTVKGLDLSGCDVFMPHEWYKEAQELAFDRFVG